MRHLQCKRVRSILGAGILVSLLSSVVPAFSQSDEAFADAVMKKGQMLVDQQKYVEAKRYFETARNVYTRLQMPSGLAAALNGLGVVLQKLGDNSAARPALEQALALANANGLDGDRVGALINLGLLEYTLGQNSSASADYNAALELASRRNSLEQLGELRQNMGMLERRFGHYNEALSDYEQALEYWQSLRTDRAAEGALDTLNSIGALENELGNPSAALTYFEEVAKLSREAGMLGQTAMGLMNVGSVKAEMGQYAEAQTYLEMALPLWKILPSRKDEAGTHKNLGMVAQDLGDYQEASQQYSVAAELFHALGLPKEEAETAEAIGTLEQDLDDYGEARKQYERAFEIYRTVGVPAELARMGCHLGDVTLEEKKPAQALDLYSKYRCSSISKGRSYLAMNDYAKATAAFSGIVHARGDLESSIASRIGLAICEERQDQDTNAEASYRQAVEQIEAQRGELSPVERKRFLSGRENGFRRLDAYEGLVRMTHRLGRDDEAFHWGDYLKGRALLDMLTESSRGTQDGISAALRDREHDLTDHIAAVYKRQRAAAQQDDSETLTRTNGELNQLQAEQRQLVDEIERKYPEYAELHYPKPIKLNQVALRDDELLLSYTVTDSATILFVMRLNKIIKVIDIAVGRADLARLVDAFREPLVKRSPLDVYLGKQIYDILLKSALAEAKPTDKVLIVPDGVLCRLPFEALVEGFEDNQSGSGSRSSGLSRSGVRYVGDSRVLSYWQSASSLTVLRKLGKRVGRPGVLAVADPVFAESDDRLKPSSARPQSNNESVADLLRRRAAVYGRMSWSDFGRLPSTTEFVDQLRAIFGSTLSEFTGLDASETHIKRASLDHYGTAIIFATHGIIDERVPYLQQAALVLSNPALTGESVEQSDGFLTASEIMDLKMPTEMAAALACDTALGEDVGGEGIMNLGRAFQYAGARSALISLWEVDDQSTNLLGEHVLAALRRGEDKDTALLSARRWLRANGYEHPYYWASFILIGERGWQSRPHEIVSARLIAIAAALLIALAVLWLRHSSKKVRM